MEVAVLNSYILYKETVVAPLSHRTSLVQDLVKLSSPISIARLQQHEQMMLIPKDWMAKHTFLGEENRGVC